MRTSNAGEAGEEQKRKTRLAAVLWARQSITNERG